MRKYIVFLFVLFLCGCSDIHTHKWQPANYQNPSMCSVCKETKGQKLTADFDRYQIRLSEGDNNYTTVCADEPLETKGTVRLEKLEPLTADDRHPEVKEYKWYSTVLKILMGDENSNRHGFNYNYLITDYYDIEAFANSSHISEEDRADRFTVNFYGKDYDQCLCRSSAASEEWQKGDNGLYYKNVTVTFELRLPEGYDGIVLGVRNSGLTIEENTYFHQYYNDSDFVLFRAGGNTHD